MACCGVIYIQIAPLRGVAATGTNTTQNRQASTTVCVSSGALTCRHATFNVDDLITFGRTSQDLRPEKQTTSQEKGAEKHAQSALAALYERMHEKSPEKGRHGRLVDLLGRVTRMRATIPCEYSAILLFYLIGV